MKVNEKVFTVAEVAKELGFSRQTVLIWIKEGKLQAFRVSRDYRINESEVKRVRGEKI